MCLIHFQNNLYNKLQNERATICTCNKWKIQLTTFLRLNILKDVSLVYFYFISSRSTKLKDLFLNHSPTTTLIKLGGSISAVAGELFKNKSLF